MMPSLGAIVIGAGPAGLAPLIAASRDGRLNALLKRRIGLIERGYSSGRGTIGDYAVTSDSTAATFLTAAEGHLDPCLHTVAQGPAAHALRTAGRRAVTLELVAEFLEAIGGTLARAVAAAGSPVLLGHQASTARLGRDGLWRVRATPTDAEGEVELTSERLVLATGGHQPWAPFVSQPFAGVPLLPTHADRLVSSDAVLRHGGADLIVERLSHAGSPRIAIAGSSTSAMSVVRLLLSALGDRLGPGAVTVLHRSAPRIFHASALAAVAEGFANDFGVDDICPITGYVFRFAGLREDSRELAMAMLKIGGRKPEPRARFLSASADEGAPARAALSEADLVVAATGYRPNLLRLVDADGAPIALAGNLGRPAVDGACHVLDTTDIPVPGVLGIGLAAGFRPSGRLGGEASFRGQVNGLWLWQNDIGLSIVDQLLSPRFCSARLSRQRERMSA